MDGGENGRRDEEKGGIHGWTKLGKKSTRGRGRRVGERVKGRKGQSEGGREAGKE